METIGFTTERVGDLLKKTPRIPDISIADCFKFICRVVGRREDCMGDMTLMRSSIDLCAMTKQLHLTNMLLYPIHVHLTEFNFLDAAYFDMLLDKMDMVYGIYETPRESIISLRDAAISLNMTINNIEPNSDEMENILLYTPNEWQMYNILVEMGHLSVENYPIDIVQDIKAGIYHDNGEKIIAAVPPLRHKSMFNNIDIPCIVDLYSVLKMPFEINVKQDEQSITDTEIAALRTAMKATVPMKDGLKVPRGSETDLMLKHCIPPHHDSCKTPGICGNCDERRENVYSQICGHFVACEECIIEFPCTSCPYCYISSNKNKILLKVAVRGVLLDKNIDSTALCHAMAPGVSFNDVLHRKINSTPRKTTHLKEIARYVSRVIDTPSNIVQMRAEKYIYSSHALHSKAVTLWFVNDPWRTEDVLSNTGTLTSIPYNEYITSHPNHSFEDIMNIHYVPKLFKVSEECVSCMEVCELLVMSKCGHQSTCRDCIKMTGSRCPVCRSEDNVAICISKSL